MTTLAAQLRRAGVAESAIPAAVARAGAQLGRQARPAGAARKSAQQKTGPAESKRIAPPTIQCASLWLPWSVLVRDNAKYGVLNGRMILTTAYRDAKAAAAAYALPQWRCLAAEPWTGDLELIAFLDEPDATRRRDPGNYRKLVTDALEGVCYANDAQLAREVWQRGHISETAPGARILVTRLGDGIP